MDSDSRACLGEISIAHCVQQQLDNEELSVTTTFLVCPTVKGLTPSGTGTRHIVLDAKSSELEEYMDTQETNTVFIQLAVKFRDLASHLF